MSQGSQGTKVQVAGVPIYEPNERSALGPIDRHRADTLGTRGSFVPYISGRRRGGAIVGWVGDRFVKKENRIRTGKGGGADRAGGTPIYYEAGWHLLCVGPAFRLHAIYRGGEEIWAGPIDSDSSPSGTTIQVSKLESFTIFWGEVNQAVNSFLGASSRVGVSSRWPYVCYIVWNRARLGTAPNWPLYEYDLEVKAHSSILTESDPQMDDVGCSEVNGPAGGHLVSQLLFSTFPHGLSLDQSLFDLDSLEYLARVLGANYAKGLPDPPPSLDARWLADDIDGDGTIYEDGDAVTEWDDSESNDRDLSQAAGQDAPLYKEDGCPGLYFRRPGVDGSVNGDALSRNSWNEIESPAFSIFGAVTVDPTKLTYNSGFVDNEFLNRTIFAINRSADGISSSHKNQIRLELEWNMDFLGSPYFDYDRSSIRPEIKIRFDNGTTLFGISNATPNIPISRKTTLVFAILLRGFNPLVADIKIPFVGHPDEAWRSYNVSSPNGPTSLDTLDVGWTHALSTSVDGSDPGYLGEAARLNELIFEHGYGGPSPPGMPTEPEAQAFVDYLVAKWACGGVSDCIVTSLLAKDGEQANSVMERLMSDLGFLMPWNPILGKHQFIALRKIASPSDLPVIPAVSFQDPLPAIDLPLLETVGDKLIFGFADYEHSFNESTLAVDDDGQADLASYQRSAKISMSTVIDFHSAGVVAERRLREALVSPVRYTLVLSHEASRYLFPGRAFYLEGFNDILRVMEVRFNPLRGTAEVSAIADIWAGALPALFELPAQGEAVSPTDPEADLAVGVIEVPAYLLGASTNPAVFVPRIPGSDQITGAVPHFSNDNTTYVEQDEQDELVTGGELTSQLEADTFSFLEDGPTFNTLGNDITEVLDLTSSLDLWAQGYQVALIGDEIFFIQGVEALGGTSYRLKGLLRARYDTVKATHAIGAKVFILLASEARALQSILHLFPGRTLYVKSQPFKNGTGLSLASISPVSRTLRGKGLVPMDCLVLRTNEGRNAYTTGQDVPLKWAYQSVLLPGTGAGMQDAGTATGDAPVDGFFRLRFYTLADVLVRTVEGLTDPTYTYTNANLQSDLGSEVGFKVSVTNYKAGYESTPLQITVVKE